MCLGRAAPSHAQCAADGTAACVAAQFPPWPHGSILLARPPPCQRGISLTLVGACAAEHRQVPAVVTHWSGTVGAVTLQHRAVERVFPVASPLHSRVMPSGDLSCALAMRCRGEAGSRASVPTVPLVRLPLTGPRHPLVHQEHWLTPDPRICQTRRTANCGRHTCRIGLTYAAMISTYLNGKSTRLDANSTQPDTFGDIHSSLWGIGNWCE